MAEQGNASQDKGEGSYSGTRDYNKRTEQFLEKTPPAEIERLAEGAAKDLEGPAGEELEQAEAAGKSRSKGEDPALGKRGTDRN